MEDYNTFMVTNVTRNNVNHPRFANTVVNANDIFDYNAKVLATPFNFSFANSRGCNSNNLDGFTNNSSDFNSHNSNDLVRSFIKMHICHSTLNGNLSFPNSILDDNLHSQNVGNQSFTTNF